MSKRKNIGVSALPTVLIISMVIIEVAVISVVLANAFNNTRFGERLAREAYSVARAGAQDAILRVLRYKDCPITPGCPSLYSLPVGERSATVSIESEGGVVTIRSTGSAYLRSKGVEVILGVDASTGEVSMQSFKEVAL